MSSGVAFLSEESLGDGVSEEARAAINLDANANAAPTEAVVRAVEAGLRTGANPSSAHRGGNLARVILEQARDAVAALIEGAYPESVVFTSGCTEANNQVIQSASAAGRTLVVSAVEHPSVLNAAEAVRRRGGEVHILPVDRTGQANLASLSEIMGRLTGPALVSIQAANSETGVLQPLDAITRIVRSRPDVWLHADAAQAFGKIPLRLGPDGIDVLTVSGHKLHAPMGVGVLVFAEGFAGLSALLVGGDQEGGLRAGTQALPMIAGLGAACAERAADLAGQVAIMATLRDALEQALLDACPGSWVNGAGAARLPNTCNIGFPGIDSTALTAWLDHEGIYASQGSACHSRRPEPSPVLRAMGLDEADAWASLRFSVSPLNTIEEIRTAVPVIVGACQRLGIRA